VIPAGAQIDTDLGVIQTSTGTPIPIKTTIVQQAGGQPSIRVFEAHSFQFDDVTVSGANALALVAAGPIVLRGSFELSASLVQAAPGAQESPAVCVGVTGKEFACGGLLTESDGGGGGGNATTGGAGGAVNSFKAGGALIPTVIPLVGGCRGGDVEDATSTVLARGGGGGGALQLVSLTSVEIRGLIQLGGGGGMATTNGEAGGGGSGGLLVIEAPSVTLVGPGGIVANGGSGGGCTTDGANGGTGVASATTTGCVNAGAGGTGSTAATNAYSCLNSGNTTCVCGSSFDGGGGAAGRLHVVSSDGAVVKTSNPTVSAITTSDTLVIH
jgi:hypothetical protein